MINQISDWRTARDEIDRARPKFFSILNSFFECLNSEWQDRLKVLVSEYGYGEKIAVDGEPQWPKKARITPDFLVAQKFPLGLITRNSCEVSEYTIDKNSRFVPEAILTPGEFIGLFEATDYLTRVPNPPIPKWNISAGACSIYALKNLATKQNADRLGKALRQHVSIVDTDLLTQLQSLDVFSQAAQHWSVRVLWFSGDWVEALRLNYARPEASRLIEHLTRRAWKSFARLRDKNPAPLQQALREATGVKGKRLESADMAALLIKRANDVLLGRQPCYVPVKADNELGPFKNICDLILSHVTSENWIMCPRYLLGENNLGYMRLDHIIPSIFNSRNGSGIKAKIIDMMSTIALAARNTRGKRRFDNEMFSQVRLANDIIFQTPGSISFSGDGDGKPSIYKIALDVSARADDISAEDFYRPLFTVLPSERCEFFRSSIRIERV